MDALPFTPVTLVAIDPARNIRRRWQVAAARDLFGMVVVETAWGRIGSARRGAGQGRALARSFPDEAQALRYIRILLARRATARRRIGVDYVAATDESMSAMKVRTIAMGMNSRKPSDGSGTKP